MTMDRTQIDAMAEALSWARTFIDDPGSALTRAETLARIDAALAPWHDEPAHTAVNGYAIHPVRWYEVDATRQAFRTLAEAEAHAAVLPPPHLLHPT